MALVPRIYDLLLEPLVRRFREVGIGLAGPAPGDRILDVGCGTGTHLALYAARGCRVTGVDRDERMLDRAAGRLGAAARLITADASALPFDDRSFDLAVSMHFLHALDAAAAASALAEMARAAPRLLVIDHHPAHDGSIRGRAIRAFVTGIERIAGGEHYRNYRGFLASGGLPALAAGAGLAVTATALQASGTTGVYLLEPGMR